MQISACKLPHHTPSKAPRCGIYFLGLLFALALSSACYTAAEMQTLAENTPDPRAAEAERVWQAMQQVSAEKGWSLDLNRKEDLLLTTHWKEVGPDLRKRVRLSVVMASRGLGISAKVRYQRRDADEPQTWQPAEDPRLDEEATTEERALVQRVHTVWQDL